MYTISSEGPGGAISLEAKLPGDTLVIAQGLAEDGRTNVTVTTPEGDVMSLRMFAALVRSIGFGRGSPLSPDLHALSDP